MAGSLLIEYGCIVVLSVCEALYGSGLSGLCFSFLSSSSFLQLLSHIMAHSPTIPVGQAQKRNLNFFKKDFCSGKEG